MITLWSTNKQNCCKYIVNYIYYQIQNKNKMAAAGCF